MRLDYYIATIFTVNHIEQLYSLSTILRQLYSLSTILQLYSLSTILRLHVTCASSPAIEYVFLPDTCDMIVGAHWTADWFIELRNEIGFSNDFLDTKSFYQVT